jgi:hypothetical protein
MVCYVLIVIDDFNHELVHTMVYDNKDKALAGAFEDFEELVSRDGWDGITEETIEKCKRKFVEDLEEYNVAYVEEFDTIYHIEQCRMN